MKAWIIENRGGVEQLKWKDVAEGPAPAGSVRVKVLGSAMNPADLKVLKGKEGGKFLHSNRMPIRLGYDFSGTTEAGEEVYGFLPYNSSNHQGTFGEAVFADPQAMASKPAKLSHAEAAGLATAGLTALQGLRDRCRVQKGSRVLINGASGGVGTAAVQIAKALGAFVTATASHSKLGAVKALGADEVIDYATQPLTGKAGSLGPGFDACLDVASNASFGICRPWLAPGGTYLTLLPSPGLLVGFVASLASTRRVRMLVVKSVRQDLEQLTRWVEAGVLKPVGESAIPLAQLPRAFELQASGKALGKVTLSA